MPYKDLTYDSPFLIAAFNAVLAHAAELVFVKDAELRYRAASLSFANMLGHEDADALTGKTDSQLFADSSPFLEFGADDRQILETGHPTPEHVVSLPTLDGAPRYGSISKYPISDGDGRTVGLFGVIRDVTRGYTARVNYQRELKFLMQQHEDTCLSALWDLTDWRIKYFAYGPRETGPIPDFEMLNDCLHAAAECVANDEDVRSFFNSFTAESAKAMYESGKRGFDLEYERNFPGGASHWVRDEARFLLDPDNEHLMLTITLRDIDTEARRRDELVTAAEHDALTGLLNRGTTMKRIERYLRNEGAGGTHALFMIDLDNFKAVNDTYGHRTGDNVVALAADAIKRTFRESDIVGRVGGDEFFALMKNADKTWAVRKKAKDLLEAMRLSCDGSEDGVDLTGSVGISMFRADRKPLETLYAEADAALYRAKAAGKNRFAYSDTSEPGIQQCSTSNIEG